MTITWPKQDLAALRALRAGLGGFHVLEVTEENRMTEQAPEQDETWGDNEAEGTTYPEHHYSLADHVFTWSPKLPDGSMLVIRAQSADELVSSVEAVAPLVGRLSAAWRQATGAGAPAPQAPAQQPWNQQPAQPYPNQPYPGQPAWQQAGAAPQAPQQNGWGGQPPQGSGLPAGWFRLNVPFQQKGAFDGIVQQYNLKKGDPFKGGQVSWRKEQKFWACAPDVAQLFGQFSPVAA